MYLAQEVALILQDPKLTAKNLSYYIDAFKL